MTSDSPPGEPPPIRDNAAAAPYPFDQEHMTIRRKVFKFLGGAFHIYDGGGQLLFYSELKAFKLKEDIRLYGDEHKSQELLTISARQILDIAATYDVRDTRTGEHVGALRRKGLASFLRDTWVFLDTQDRELGTVQEDSLALGLIRRFLSNLVPQSFEGSVNNRQVCFFRQHFNPFILKVDADFSMDTEGLLDRRLGIAALVLLCAIEGRQN